MIVIASFLIKVMCDSKTISENDEYYHDPVFSGHTIQNTCLKPHDDNTQSLAERVLSPIQT
jgi:hypothetical protein